MQFERDPSGIVVGRFRVEVSTLEHAVENRDAVAQFAGDGKVRIFVDMSQVRSLAREARAYYAGPEFAEIQSRCALLIQSKVGRVIGNFFMGLNKPPYPTRLFTSEQDARSWLSR